MKILKFLLFFIFVSILGTIFPVWGIAQEPASEKTVVETPSPTPTQVINRDLEKAGTDLLKDRPWLTDLYSWNETFDLDRQQVKANETGAYCIGNGRAFALI